MLKCPYCPREFENRLGLGIHIGHIHKNYPLRPLNPSIKCTLPSCGEMIVKRGYQTDSLYMGTVDGEKKPFHRGCYYSAHSPSKRPEVREKLSKITEKQWADMSEEERADFCAKLSKGRKRYLANMSEEEKFEYSKVRIDWWANMSEEERTELGAILSKAQRKSNRFRNAMIWMFGPWIPDLYGDEWGRIVKSSVRVLGCKCEYCGAMGNVNLHHVIAVKDFVFTNPDDWFRIIPHGCFGVPTRYQYHKENNLVRLCSKHHRMVEGKLNHSIIQTVMIKREERDLIFDSSPVLMVDVVGWFS